MSTGSKNFFNISITFHLCVNFIVHYTLTCEICHFFLSQNIFLYVSGQSVMGIESCYHSQKIIYSKYGTDFINKKVG